MQFATYEKTNDVLAPTRVFIGERSTPVWRQNRWETGEYQEFIRNNGCGHCCTAMALNLYGIAIDPHGEYCHCRELWGAPQVNAQKNQHHYMSVSGIVKVLTGFGVPAAYFGVPSDAMKQVESHIDAALRSGKQVIFWSRPQESFPDNPFSAGDHYVMAVGYAENGFILIANSSERTAPDGVQFVTLETVLRALFPDATPADLTWGRTRQAPRGCGVHHRRIKREGKRFSVCPLFF